MCIFSVVHFQVKSQKAAPAICKKSMEDKSIKVVQRPPNILFHLCSDFVIFVSSHSKPFALNRAIVLFFCAFTFLLWILDQIFLLSELTRPHLITTSNFPSFNLALSRSGESAARPLHNHHYHHLHHHHHFYHHQDKWEESNPFWEKEGAGGEFVNWGKPPHIREVAMIEFYINN